MPEGSIMCGICGIVGASGLDPGSRDLVRAMCASIIHRGPDDEGYYFDDRAALGMRRLSIIDLRTGHQPISNEDKTVWTVYNGEIFNFPVLRDELLAKGHAFTTNTDTEVIVHLYEEHGPEFMHKLNGMFAIALWDKTRRRFMLVRDRLGVKPLHYAVRGGDLFFASEIKALLKAGLPRELDREALSRFFTFEYIPAPQTIFKGLAKLPPGHKLIFQDGRVDIQPYWDVRFRSRDLPPRPVEDYADEIYRRLKESVRIRLMSDVPLGVFLSGGVDSSAVTALMSETAGSRVQTYSIGFREKSFDELDYARRVAEHFGTEHTEFVVDASQVRDLVPTLMQFLDEPLADASIIPTFIISKLARRHVTVALAGDGGDELFGGYDTYKAYKAARLYQRVPRFLRQGLVRPAVRLLPASKKRLSLEFKAKKFIAGVEYPPEVANVIWWGAYTPGDRMKLFTPEFLASLREDPYAPVASCLSRAPGPEADTLDRLAYLDLKLYLQDDLLVKVDRMSMANSLEIRTPFLDYTFVEFAATIPSRLKLKGFTSKYILKKMLKGRVPDEVLTRKKIGFDIPLGPWIREELWDFANDTLSPAALARHGFFNAAYVRGLLEEHKTGAHNHRQLLWPLIIFQFWHDHYLS
jgi:asparagine synthase (glutamine-hydrolysing)